MISRALAYVLVCLGFSSAIVAGQTPTESGDAFRDGARWCFVGDGSTHHGAFVTWFRAYAVTRFPDRVIEVSNAGVQGDTIDRSISRFGWDVAAHRPTSVALYFGPGLASGPLREAATENHPATAAVTYAGALRTWLDRIQSVGATPWVIAPLGAAQDEAVTRAVDAALAVATDIGAPYVDAREALNALQATQQSPAASARVSTGSMQDLAVLSALLRATGAPPEVSALTVDLRSGRFAAANSVVDQMVRGDAEVTFLWTSKALPLPLPAELQPASRRVAEDFNREILQVQGLRAGRWALVIDGEAIREYTHLQLESGVNLGAELLTPQNRQARDVLRLLQAHDQLVADNLRSVALVEHRLAPGDPRPLEGERMRALVTEAIVAGAVPPGEREAFELYSQRKGKQGLSAAAAARLLVQARQAAQPQPHLYLLRLLK